MSAVTIIGSAGRRGDRAKVSQLVYDRAYATVLNRLEGWRPGITLVSGGAAFMDHLAVNLYLQDQVEHLILHLPAPLENSRFLGQGHSSPGQVANHYHRLFSRKVNLSSLRQLQQALDKGAEVHVHQGFYQRNIQVGRVDCVIALTFGTRDGSYIPTQPGWRDPAEAGLKLGGTSHTWSNSNARVKEHINLHNLM